MKSLLVNIGSISFQFIVGIKVNYEIYCFFSHLQTALMQACQYGHWEVVQILMLFKANVRSLSLLLAGLLVV